MNVVFFRTYSVSVNTKLRVNVKEEEDVSRTEVKGHDEARSKGRQPVWVDDADEVERLDNSLERTFFLHN